VFCREALVSFGELLPGIAGQATLPFVEVGEMKDGAFWEFEVGPA
jgi:hypothetical protein